MITRLTIDALAELNSAASPPCLSLYQPTHRHRPDNTQDSIRFRNLLRSLEQSLIKQYADADVRRLLKPLKALLEDHQFWQHNLDGLAVLRAAEIFRVFRLQRAVPELAVVADSFHTKPLRRFLQSVDGYQVLGLSRGKVLLFEGNRNALDLIDADDGIPRSITEALGDELTEPRLNFASYGGAGASQPMYHGHGGKKEEVDLDAERFFRLIDRDVLEQHSRRTGLPLVLAALPEHHNLFQRISHNPYLLEQGLDAYPEGIGNDELRQRVWEVIEPQHRARQEALASAFFKARSQGRGSDDLAQVGTAAATGRVATLLIESGRQIAGRIDAATGQIQIANLNQPNVDDLLDDIGELVTLMGGDVQVLAAASMPATTGLAATYRH